MINIYTIGVYNSTEDSYFNKLKINNIDLFCDIRQRRGVRGSQYKYVNSNYLQSKLADMGGNELIRILNERGGNLEPDAPYEIGDVWEMNAEPAWNRRPAPHCEDTQTTAIRKINNVGIQGIIDFIKKCPLGNRLTEGSLSGTFEGCLRRTAVNGAFINQNKIPSFSTQFWIPDRDLTHFEYFGKPRYKYNDIIIRYVGFQQPIDVIPAGTIVRLSLANWWSPNEDVEKRCYLQVSGWYIA